MGAPSIASKNPLTFNLNLHGQNTSLSVQGGCQCKEVVSACRALRGAVCACGAGPVAGISPDISAAFAMSGQAFPITASDLVESLLSNTFSETPLILIILCRRIVIGFFK